MKRLRNLLAAVVGFGVIAVGTGTAYAFWLTDGAGSSSSTLGGGDTVTVEAFLAGDAPTGTLLPGGPARDVILRVDNPNDFAVDIVSITGSGPITGENGTGTCTTTGVTFTAPDVSTITPSKTIGAHSNVLLHLPGAASMSSSSSAGCQGATFHIPVTLTVQR